MKEIKKIFTAEEFRSHAVPLINEGLTVPLKINGGSMEPFLVHERDTVFITKPDFPLKVGDIAFFERENGRIVMHRVCNVKNEDYFFIGDAETKVEGPVSKENIFGIVYTVNRKGKKADKRNFTFWFFRNIWIRIIPLRPFAMKVYRMFSAKGK